MAGIDDANIFFVYARNIVHGQGIVYNVGGEHVEGYSSMLYLMLCSLAFWLSRAPELTLFIVNFLFAAIASTWLMVVLIQMAENLQLGREGKLLLCGAYLVWLLANPAYFAWSVVTLMDSGTYSLVLTVGYSLLALLLLRNTTLTARQGIQVGAMASLCIVARPEGIGWALLQAFAFACLCWAQSRSWRTTLRLAAVPAAFTLLTYGALVGFRVFYFGYPLPNTYYAKVSSSHALTLAYGEDSAKFFAQQYGLIWSDRVNQRNL
jgi:arabinofuranosyltransferase